MGMDAEQALYERMGLQAEMLDAGCCGLAGSFGFEAGHYDVSMAIGEQRLLPAVRAAGRDELLIANGFSCQTQIEQGAGRTPRHLAQVIASALPTRREPEPVPDRRAGALTGVLIAGGAALAAGLLVGALTRGHPGGRE
jgi:hypothetical protein